MTIFKTLSLFYVYLFIICGKYIASCTESSSESSDESASEFEDQLITVDIKNRFNTQGVKYTYNKSRDCHTFTANTGYLIDKVTKGNTVLWNAKNYGNVYGDKVFVGVGDGGNRVFRVYFPQPLHPELLEPPKPLEPETIKPRLVTLDIRNKISTQEVKYKYVKKNSTHTFTPNKGYLIHEVMRKGKLMWVCENGVYPEKILIFPNEEDEMILRIQFPKVDYTPEEPFETDHKLIDLDLDNTRPNPLYSIKYTGFDGEYAIIYEAKSVYKFKSVIDGTKMVWWAMGKHDCAYKVKYVYNECVEQRLTIFFTDGRIKTLVNPFFSFSLNNWKECRRLNDLN